MSEFKEKLTEAGMSEPLAALLDEKLSAQQNAQASCGDKSSGVASAAYRFMGACAGSDAGKRSVPIAVLASLAVITLAALKYLIFD